MKLKRERRVYTSNRLCDCGCGRRTTKTVTIQIARFIHGHQSRVPRKEGSNWHRKEYFEGRTG